MANIKSNNYRKIDCRILDDVYMDFMLSKDEVNKENNEECLCAKLHFNSINAKYVVSDVSWQNAASSNETLDNIGFTGVDNGFIAYSKDRISNDDFLKLYTNSHFNLNTFGDKFFVTQVSGNTQLMQYPLSSEHEYTALKGGFYQGFFKIEGKQYQTLPHRIENEWNFNITLRPKNYQVPSNTINMRHPNNKGMFFYIGTRAENKFWEMYKHSPDMEKLNINADNYCPDFILSDCNVTECQYSTNDGNENTVCDNVFADDYMEPSSSLEKIKIVDSKGNSLQEKGFYEIETDNKFILFHRGNGGENINTWDESFNYILTGKTDTPNVNYYPYLNQTATGYTKDKIDILNEQYQYDYDIYQDIRNNAFGIKLNDDGSMTYRFLTSTCEPEQDYEIKEETTMPGIVTPNEWANIHIKMVRMPDNNELCINHIGKMKIYLYVNGNLKFVSQELSEIILSPLNDTPERQEGVPYNISIGGGTQGLSERIYLDYYNTSNYVLPLEEYFAGSFIGDIKDFSFYDCHLPYSSISKLGCGF